MPEHLEKQGGVFAVNEKKVIAVIVEGLSDEAALGSILKEYFSSVEIQFVVVHGDITTKDYTSTDNILSKINNLIESVKQKYGYKREDFLKIIHIVDMDGAFCDDAIVEKDVEGVRYYLDRIETKYPDYLIRKHTQKAEILSKLYSSEKINGVSYRIYFNSCNLEHVLFNELKDFTDDEKADMADDFAEKYEGKVEDFIEFISQDDLIAPGTFKQTWQFIEKEKHSLERFTNMHLIFK